MTKFKVGDRVRFKKSYPTSVAGSEAVVVAVTNLGIQVDTPSFGRSTESPDSMEPALTIETCKFYRTRDGRKVGPATARTGDLCGDGPWRLDGWNYDNDGICSNLGGRNPKDLIAEWVDEPASNDNAPATTPAIVAIIENGQPKPSEKSKVHKSEESATDEAERLAVKYPGQKFGVFVLADSRIADVVIRRAA